MAPATDEFPLLADYGLMYTNTTGDGNCLFNALSDQMYGNECANRTIRERTVDEMRANPAEYMTRMTVHPGGGVRSNPKRSTKRNSAGALTEPAAEVTAEDTAKSWSNYLKNMSKSGVYGDNLEVLGFTQAYKKDVVIFTSYSHILYFPYKEDGVRRDTLFLALHDYEHYSTVRNIAGPFKGPANVVFDWEKFAQFKADGEKTKWSTSRSPTPPDKSTIAATNEKVAELMKTLPYSEEKVRKALGACSGCIAQAASRLLDEEEKEKDEDEEYSSYPGTTGSLTPSDGTGSVKRDHDDEDDSGVNGPNKRRKTETPLKPTIKLKVEPVSEDRKPAGVKSTSIAGSDKVLAPKTEPKRKRNASEGDIEVPGSNKRHKSRIFLKSIPKNKAEPHSDTEYVPLKKKKAFQRGATSSKSTPAPSRANSMAPYQSIKIKLNVKREEPKLSPATPSTSPASSLPSPPPSFEDVKDNNDEGKEKKRRRLVSAREFKRLHHE
ncbi:hypothetical protein HYALB_00009301 [Hymenoscyphus albidus]|uniref:OTU domain-containing protein n=1 Tax=Hymenoscyphus albidus TaxID=595503 RepID=A0A9N9Q3Z6_9HELO|nr:hypothetical protein HYALB_00009301 [Hymenoscyphus albidus]